jgi:AraC-like DNA-binding protein
MQTEEFKNTPSYLVVVLGIAVFTQGYFIWGLVLIRKYRRNIKNYFSQITHIDLSWLRFILISAIIAYALNSCLYLLDYLLDLFNYKVMQLSSFIVGSLYILFMGFYGLRQTNVFKTISEKSSLNHTQKTDIGHTILATEDEQFIRKLLNFFQNEKPFLQPDITLLELSRQLNVTPEYLSKILNKHLHQHFFDFINQFRVEAFKDACRNPENHKLSIIGVAYDCGFNSKATFNRVFKNMTGTTPGNYLKSIL